MAWVAALPVPLLLAVVLVWLTFESAGVPLPNEAVILAVGVLVGQGRVPFVAAVAAALAGAALGSGFAYAVGRRWGRAGVVRAAAVVHVDSRRVLLAERFFKRYGWLAVAVGRVTPFLRNVVSYSAGVLHMPLPAFWLSTLAGSLVWTVGLVYVGQRLGQQWHVLQPLVQRFTLGAVLVVVVVIAVLVVVERRIGRVIDAEAAKTLEDS